jgi:hypothetical protein
MQHFGPVPNYTIYIHPSTWAGPEPQTETRRVLITDIPLFGGGLGLASLNFIPEGLPVPDSTMQAGAPVTFDLYLPMDDYTAVVDLLRNEGPPITFLFDDADPNGWHLAASGKPGEDQGK